jgi:serine/threonine protein phosphatase PrpC
MWTRGATTIAFAVTIWLQVITPVVLGEYLGEDVSDKARLAMERESGPDASFAQSLTRDFLFFATFVGQVVLFLIFFWEKPTSTKRWNVGEEAASEEKKVAKVGEESQTAVASSSGASQASQSTSSTKESDNRHSNEPVAQVFIAPPEGSRALSEHEGSTRASTQLDDAFEPVESTIRDLQLRITGLERTLNRRKGNYPTESLKTRLRDCISTITGTLARLEDQAPSDPAGTAPEVDRSTSPNRLDITKWPLESIQSSKRQLEAQLQQLEAGFALKDDRSHSPVHTASLHSKDDSSSAPTQLTSAPTSSPQTIAPNEEIQDQELEHLAQLLNSKKGGRKGGKVKISPKDLSALNFLAEVSEPASTSPVSKSGDEVDSISDESHSAATAIKPSDITAVVNTSSTESTSTEEPQKTPTSDPEGDSSLKAPTVEPTADDDGELADLAKLLGGKKGGKKDKHASKDKNKPVKETSGPANIFNMFTPPSPAKPDPAIKSHDEEDQEDQEDDTDDLSLKVDDLKDFGDLSDLTVPDDLALPADDSTDLLAALNAVSGKSGNDDDESTDEESTSDDESSISGTNSEPEESEEEEEEEFDDIARERPPISAFSVSEALNKSGLQRAKKTPVMTKGGKKAFQMEDFHFCEYPWQNDNWGLFCVMDGHSGKDCAEKASRLIPEYLAKHLKSVDLWNVDPSSGGVDLSEVLKKTFLDTDKELMEFEYEGATCTVVFVYKTSSGRRYVQGANVGDSSATLIRKNKPILLTTDHHCNYPIEVKRLAALGIEVTEGQTRLNGLAVSRALGDHFPKSTDCGIVAEPSVSQVYELKGSDSSLILASDGLWDVISFQTANDIIKDLDSASEMSDALLKTATRSSKCTDNVTTVVVQL